MKHDEMKPTWTLENQNMSKALCTMVFLLNKNDLIKIAADDEKYRKFTEALFEVRRQVKQMGQSEEMTF